MIFRDNTTFIVKFIQVRFDELIISKLLNEYFLKDKQDIPNLIIKNSHFGTQYVKCFLREHVAFKKFKSMMPTLHTSSTNSWKKLPP